MKHADRLRRHFHSVAWKPEPVVADVPPRLVIRTCKRIQESGTFCQAAAVGSRSFCRAHLRLDLRRRKMARARRRAGFLKLPPLMDMAVIQVGMARVQVALEADHIDAGCARLLHWAMRMAVTNLRFVEQQGLTSSFGAGAKGLDRSHRAGRKPKQLYQMQINPCDSMSYNNNTS